MKNIILVVCFGVLLLTSGCGINPQDKSNASHDLKVDNLAEYIQSIEMPKNLSIVFNPTEVAVKSSAKAYNAAWLKLDPQKTAEYLLRYDIMSTKQYAEGPWFQAGNGKQTEYLSIHDGVVKGGLSYILFDNGNDSLYNKLTCVIEPNPGFPDAVAQTLLFTRKTDYTTKKDLAFMPYQKAVAETEKVFTGCGITALSVQEVYSLDLEIMSAHYQFYIDTRKAEDSVNLFAWSKNDECYLIQFRQIVDGIPLINTMWEEGMRKDREATETPIYAFYSKDGVISIYAASLYNIGDVEKEGPLIRSSNALQILLDDYKKAIPISETKVLSMELNYVGTYSKEKIQLVPTWIFCISRSVKMKNADRAVDEYTYFVINAFTGERIRTAVDSQ